MSITGYLRGWWVRYCYAAARRKALGKPAPQLGLGDWPASLADPTGFYERAFAAFLKSLPPEFREHRAYFHNVPGNRRGYGEDAFHTLWFLLLEKLKPANFLEIGIFRGQVISLVALWAKLRHQPLEVHGISPFSSAGDSVTKYRADIDYYTDTLANFDHFGLPHPGLLRAYSTDASAREYISARSWDLIYIDGNHDYEVVCQDWDACSRALKPGGVVVFDDAALHTDFKAPPFASRGHPGPSRLVTEIDPARFRRILQVGHNLAFERIS